MLTKGACRGRMPSRGCPWVALLFLGLATLGGCGAFGSTARPTVRPLATKSYRDSNYGFSFRYPAIWTAARRGRTESQANRTQYVLPINTHDSNVSLQIVMDTQLIAIPTVTPGKIGTGSNGSRYRYYNLRISGYLALQGQRLYKRNQVDDIETVVNSRTYSFTIRMLAVKPPFSALEKRGYNLILRSMKLPF